VTGFKFGALAQRHSGLSGLSVLWRVPLLLDTRRSWEGGVYPRASHQPSARAPGRVC